MSNGAEPEVLHTAAGGLFEAPRVVDGLGTVFSDAANGGVFVHSPADGVRLVVPHRRGIGGLVPHRLGGLVVGGRNIAHKRLDAPDDTVVLLAPDDVPGATGFNDLTADPAGRLYVGVLGRGAIVLVDLDGSSDVVATGVEIPNGMCPSPDGDRLYAVDSGRNVVLRYDVDTDTGALSGGAVVVEVDEGVADGLAVAADGTFLVAHANAGFVGRYGPDGDQLDRRWLPEPFVTSVCLDQRGGMFVTTGASGDRPATLCRVDTELRPGGTLLARIELPA